MMYSWIFILAISIWVILYFDEKRNINSNESQKNKPLEILKCRFASGDLTEEEYEESRAVLEGDEYFNTYP